MVTTAAATDMVMPSLTDGMESGTIVAWLLTDGAVVTPGDELLEVETDKATATVAAEHGGRLQIVVRVGATAAVGETIARIGGEAPVEAQAQAPAPSPGPDPALAPVPPPSDQAEGPHDEVTRAAVRASPVARRVARQQGVDLGAVSGSGPGGRIVRTDVEQAAGLEPAAPAPVSASVNGGPAAAKVAAPPPTAPRDNTLKGEVTCRELTRVQEVVARRMAQAKAGAPEFVIGVEVDMEEAVELRTRLKVLAGEAKPPSYNDFVVKACAMALCEFPLANGAYVDGVFELYARINVGIAVAAADALVVPTIFDADRKSLGEIGRDARRLAAAVRDGKASLADLSGGTFTVSNLGMFGISEFTSILNPPQAAILSVGEMRRTPVEHEGEIALRHTVKLRMTCDHRILYGADAAGFLQRIKQLLQAPLAMSL